MGITDKNRQIITEQQAGIIKRVGGMLLNNSEGQASAPKRIGLAIGGAVVIGGATIASGGSIVEGIMQVFELLF